MSFAAPGWINQKPYFVVAPVVIRILIFSSI